jgi:hypothetical protein
MDIEYARQLLAIYIENARRVLRAHFGVDRAERSFFNLIELLREETKLGPIFVQAVRDGFIEHDPRSYQDGVCHKNWSKLPPTSFTGRSLARSRGNVSS